MEGKLIMFKANGQRKDFPLVNSTTIIGRAEQCDLRVPLLSVSRRHCELSVSEQGFSVKDLASSNGTYVNNQRVNEVELRAGDRLVIGPIVFTLQIDGQPDEIQPVKTRGQVLSEQSHPGAKILDDIEAEIAAGLDESGMDETLVEENPVDGLPDADSDPISALEALAEEDKQQQQNEKQ